MAWSSSSTCLGTHLGPLPPSASGNSFRCRMSAFFMFDGDRIVCRARVLRPATILAQLGLAHDPSSLAGRLSLLASHPLTIARRLLRSTGSRSGAPAAERSRARPGHSSRYRRARLSFSSSQPNSAPALLDWEATCDHEWLFSA